MPPADQVREAVARVLASDVFARSERARDLLRYIVEQDLEGNADRLKGFSIAVDVFGRGKEFDPATDTVVRVQAGRLRDLLAQYYAREGAGDPLRLTIPRGSYVPEYNITHDDPADPIAPADADGRADDDASRPKSAWRSLPAGRSWFAALGLCLVALIVAGSAYRFLANAETRGEPPFAAVGGFAGRAAPAADMLPRVFFDQREGAGVRHIAGPLRRGLASFDTILFIGRPHDSNSGPVRPTDFTFIVEEGSQGDVHIELQSALAGKVLLSRNFMVERLEQEEIEDTVATILTSLVPVSGIIYASLAETGTQTRLSQCLFLNEEYYRDQSAERHRSAYRCLERLDAAGIKQAQVQSELAALHLQAVTSPYAYPPNASFDRALGYARQAIQLSPDSPYAHRAMGYVLSRTASPKESLRWTRKAYELNTFDLGMAASYGYALIFDGAYAEGVPILRRAVAATSAHPSWWDYGLFLGEFMLRDMQAASDAVSALASSNRAHYIAARLIAAYETRNLEQAATLAARLQESHPSFASDPEGFFRKGKYPEDMKKQLLGGLREAGLSGAM